MRRCRPGVPAAVGCFTDDLDALLAIHWVPVRLRIWVRTTDERVKWQLVRTSPVSLPAVAA